MKIIIFGAAGDVGSRIVAEAMARGHDVTAVIRSKTQRAKLPTRVNVRIGDASIASTVSALALGQDLIISALRPKEGSEALLAPLSNAILNGAAAANVRVLIVGGAASLKIPDGSGETVLTAPDFLPDHVVPIARACFAQYETILKNDGADWTYLTPPAMLIPGERRAAYQTGLDHLLTDSEGISQISMEDLAVALLDEAETPKYRRRRFTVAYA